MIAAEIAEEVRRMAEVRVVAMPPAHLASRS
jgi:hypothetical protein